MDPIEKEIQAKGLTAPRITPDDIEAAIASEHYFTAQEGVLGMLAADGVPASAYEQANSAPKTLALLTFCVLVLRNGFTVAGKSACASPENFDAELGRKIARQDAISQVWPLMGYELRSKLAAIPVDYRDRVCHERHELTQKLVALDAFIQSERFANLPDAERHRLREQQVAMASYLRVLRQRIDAFAEGAPA